MQKLTLTKKINQEANVDFENIPDNVENILNGKITQGEIRLTVKIIMNQYINSWPCEQTAQGIYFYYFLYCMTVQQFPDNHLGRFQMYISNFTKENWKTRCQFFKLLFFYIFNDVLMFL